MSDTTPETIAKEIVNKWGYEEPYWWKPIAEALKEAEEVGFKRGKLEILEYLCNEDLVSDDEVCWEARVELRKLKEQKEVIPLVTYDYEPKEARELREIKEKHEMAKFDLLVKDSLLDHQKLMNEIITLYLTWNQFTCGPIIDYSMFTPENLENFTKIPEEIHKRLIQLPEDLQKHARSYIREDFLTIIDLAAKQQKFKAKVVITETKDIRGEFEPQGKVIIAKTPSKNIFESLFNWGENG